MAENDDGAPSAEDTRPLSLPAAPPGPPGYSHLHDRVDRLHAEHKQTVQEVNTIKLRLGKLEFVDEQTDKRLREGAETFEALRRQIVRPWWQTVLLIAPGILIALGWAYQIGGMPSRSQFEATRDDVRSLQVQQARFEAGIDALQKSMDTIDRKLDELRAAPATRPLP